MQQTEKKTGVSEHTTTFSYFISLEYDSTNKVIHYIRL